MSLSLSMNRCLAPPFAPGRSRISLTLSRSFQKRAKNVTHTKKRLNETTNEASKSSFSLSSPVQWYAKKLENNPLTTKCITSGIISGSGDLICQYIMYKKQNQHKLTKFDPDWIRTGRFTLLGFGLVAPIVHHWYGFLTRKIPGQSTKKVITRLFCDQVLFAPPFVTTFMSSLMLLEGKDAKEISPFLKRDLVDVVVTNWSLWVPAMYLNFKFIPVQWQVLFSNCVGLVWNIFLSWTTQEKGKDI